MAFYVFLVKSGLALLFLWCLSRAGVGAYMPRYSVREILLEKGPTPPALR